jgi:hypothetical protein
VVVRRKLQPIIVIVTISQVQSIDSIDVEEEENVAIGGGGNYSA